MFTKSERGLTLVEIVDVDRMKATRTKSFFLFFFSFLRKEQ